MPLRATVSAIGFTLVLACGGSACGADNSGAKASRNWQTHPAILQIDTPEVVFAVGDPHADLERLTGVLKAAGVIAKAGSTAADVRWTAGKSVLVLTGDMIDKWVDSLGVIRLMMALQQDAAARGGQVIVTMGNHEAEFLAYAQDEKAGKKTKDFAQDLTAAGLDPEAVRNCAGAIGRFLCGLPIGVRVNDWFFSHGGNTGHRSIAALNTAIEDDFASHGFGAEELVGANSILEARLNKKGPNGLPWFQDGQRRADPQILLRGDARKLGVNHLVQGHQYGKVSFPDGRDRSEETLFQRYGLLFLIDSGMSQGIDDSNSTGGALRISGPPASQEAVVLCANGSQATLWDSKKQQDHKQQFCGK